MTSTEPSLRRLANDQVRALASAVGLGTPQVAEELVTELLGVAGTHPLCTPPHWQSDISDDQTPVEFSIAFDTAGNPTLRMLGAPVARPGDGQVAAALRLLATWADRYQLSLDRFEAVRELFLPPNAQGFGLWFSVIFRPEPEFKVYLDPNARGGAQAPALVAHALRVLGLAPAHPVIAHHALARPQDRFAFFALDLHAGAQARVKVYVAHHEAGAEVAERACLAVPGVDPEQVSAFCRTVGGPLPFTTRPLISSYSFSDPGSAVPDNYSLYVPVREAVADDEVTLNLLRTVLREQGLRPDVLEQALRGIARRPLAEGVGMIPHVSLRTGSTRQGLTVYLSTEAFHTTPARSRTGHHSHA
ncbi:DMATS family aromatic prenyltransferase [Kutzneria viridogrisea]|uniref:DMATS type aromatic prenyltransferase n=1 Tax=Kutzneria viridogrisea TaxID=47990 RepID=A0ABR6BNQ4_9PSEU|nr:DMATS type aromatic prenyltransferase [Kutzneria viridogrisea]